MVALHYGVEGYVTKRHLKKEDGTEARVDETLDFKVLDFNKNGRKIVISHLRTFEEDKRTAEEKKESRKKAEAAEASKKVSQINKSAEKSTLGDLDVLSDLKSKMEKAESKGGDDAPAE